MAMLKKITRRRHTMSDERYESVCHQRERKRRENERECKKREKNKQEYVFVREKNVDEGGITLRDAFFAN